MKKIAAAIFPLIVNRKSLIVILLTILYSLLTIHFSGPVHAQDCTPSAGFSYGGVIDDVNKCAIKKNIFDDKIFNWNQITGTADSLNVLITGYSLNHPETNEITANTGALAGLSRGIALAYAAPPVSGVEYFAGEIKKFNPIQPAYAQAGGLGFAALEPVQQVWGTFRNASYVAFVIIFVIMGFMIMFRAHISPQAVATVQDSIPRIVVALILVTFSYAIAGLMVDLMYVVINIAIAVLAGAGLNVDAAQNVFKENIFGLILLGWGEMVTTTAGVISGLLGDIFKELFHGTSCTPVLSSVGDCVGKAIAWIFGWVGGIILGIALVFIMVRVFFMLLMAYVTIIILTIVAPFFFLIQALPGNNGAKEWFKQMASNVAVFPAVIIMFLLAGLLGGIGHFGGNPATTFGSSDLFQGPLLTSGFDAATLGKLIAIGLILMTPEAANLVKKFIGGPGGGGGGFAPGAAIGAAIGAGAAPVGAFGGAAVTRGPIGGLRRSWESARGEEAALKGRKAIAGRAEAGRGGITATDIEKYGIGYGKK